MHVAPHLGLQVGLKSLIVGIFQIADPLEQDARLEESKACSIEVPKVCLLCFACATAC